MVNVHFCASSTSGFPYILYLVFDYQWNCTNDPWPGQLMPLLHFGLILYGLPDPEFWFSFHLHTHFFFWCWKVNFGTDLYLSASVFLLLLLYIVLPCPDVGKYFQVADELVAEFTDPSSSLASPDQVRNKVQLFLILCWCDVKVELYSLTLFS